MLSSFISALPLAGSQPAGGAAVDQVVIATAGATIASSVLLFLLVGHRWGRRTVLRRLAAFSERMSGLPGWAALPLGIAGGALLIALVGMYWDISLHIDQGRDPGPLANPAHYLILVGLFGVFTAGVLAIALPVDEHPGRAAVRVSEGWYAPVGGVLIAACGAFSLIAFPLDDVWHRLFGQDVTLWGPTHLMLIGGAGMCLVGQAILLSEGMRARREAGGRRAPASRPGTRLGVPPGVVVVVRRVSLMGGFLIGLSTFQAEFDFGVPQYDQLFQPMLIALAAGVGLTAARVWIGPGGALGAAVFYLAVRGLVSVTVGPVLGETTPALPLYLVEAACVELAALALARRPLAFGAASGLLVGTVGFAAEYGWTHLVFRLPWTGALLPEGVVAAVLAGVAGGLVGTLLALGLRGELPSPAVARALPAGALAVVAALIVYGLSTSVPKGASASVALTKAPGGEANATVRLHPASLGEGARWVTVTAWQGGGLQVERLRRVAHGVYRSTAPFPAHGDWKTMLRVHPDHQVVGTPLYLPRDAAIPAKEVPAAPRFTRAFRDDKQVLQRERKGDVPGWLWGAAVGLVMALYVGFLTALAWGVGRVGRRGRRPRGPDEPTRAPAGRLVVGTPKPVGA